MCEALLPALHHDPTGIEAHELALTLVRSRMNSLRQKAGDDVIEDRRVGHGVTVAALWRHRKVGAGNGEGECFGTRIGNEDIVARGRDQWRRTNLTELVRWIELPQPPDPLEQGFLALKMRDAMGIIFSNRVRMLR